MALLESVSEDNDQSQRHDWRRMVLARRIGQPRPFPLVLLLYVATFGIYGVYWHYKTHHEVYRQFELDLEGRDEGLVWLLLDRFFFPLRWIFQYGFVGNVAHVRRRLGQKGGMRPATFLGLTIPGSIAVYAALTLFFVALSFIDAENGARDPFLANLFSGLSAGLFLLGAGLQVPAYWLLQRDMNRVWQAYDDRLAALIPPYGSPPADAPRPAPATPPSDPAAPAWPDS